MKPLKLLLLSLLLVGIPSLSFGNAFQHLHPLINIPIAKKYDPGTLEYRITVSGDRDYLYDFDLGVNYAWTDRFKFGFTVYTETQMAGHVEGVFLDNKFVAVAGGINNIAKNNFLVSRNDYPIDHKNNNSPYVTMTVRLPFMNIHGGIGNYRFQSAIVEENSFSNGLFYGLDLPFMGARLMADYDGKGYNVGFRFNTGGKSEATVALTEAEYLLEEDATNDQYGDAPARFVTMDFVFRQHIGNYYLDQKNALEAYTLKMDSEFERLQALRQEYEKKILTLDDTQDTFLEELQGFRGRVDRFMYDMKFGHVDGMTPSMNSSERKEMILYNESFMAYQEGNLEEAVTLIQNAIKLNPKNPNHYKRLGSYYYEMGLRDLAITYWQTAYDIDPSDEELKFLFEDI